MKKTHNPDTSEREAFLRFCQYVQSMEGDKDKFLAAAKLQRTEKQPTFTAAQLIGLAVLLGVLLLGSVAIICLTLTGKTGYILPALGGTLVTTFLVGMLVISEI